VPRLFLTALVVLLLASGCRPTGDASGERVVVYSGRSQALVDGFVESYRAESERDVQVRYGRDAELLAALAEEGGRSPAGIFWANTVGALTALAQQGRLIPLPDSLLGRPAAFAPSGGRWVPVTVRFRVLAYHPERVDPAALPASVMDLPGVSALRGRIGWTPTYSSFQDFVTAIRAVHGDAAARQWLDGMRALSPNAYPSNAPMLEALMAGEIDLALTNHYYILRVTEGAREGVTPALATYHFASGDVGNLALVTGAGILDTSTNPEGAARFLSYLLSPAAQAEAARRAFEYPVVRGAPVPAGSVGFDDALRLGPDLDFDQLQDLDGTLRLLREAGLL
jgi:iron(III) transport system substrate-binding protein